MLDSLLPIVLTSLEEGLAYLKRETADRIQAIAALNQAAAMLEMLTGRKLAFRTYRDPVNAGTVTATADSKQLTSIADTSIIKVGDAAIGSRIRPGSQVVSIDSATAVTLNVAALSAGTFTLTVGSAPEQQDGAGRDPWTWDRNDWPIYTDETPISEVFDVRQIDDANGTETSMDLTGMRIQKQTGAIYLPNEIVDPGKLTLEIHYSAGYRWPASASEGDPTEVLAAQLATHRLAQVNFQDWANARGRTIEASLGARSSSSQLAIPDDVLRLVELLRRRS